MPELATAPVEGQSEQPAAAPQAAKAPAKKAVKKAAKAASNGAKDNKPKSPVGKPQGRILKVLAKATKPLTRKEISEKAQVDNAYCTSYLGSADEATRAKNDKGTMSLVSLGMIKFGPKQEEGGAVTYVITAKGKTTAEKL